MLTLDGNIGRIEAAQLHDRLPAYSGAMLSHLMPLAVVTLLAGFLKRRPARL